MTRDALTSFKEFLNIRRVQGQYFVRTVRRLRLIHEESCKVKRRGASLDRLTISSTNKMKGDSLAYT